MDILCFGANAAGTKGLRNWRNHGTDPNNYPNKSASPLEVTSQNETAGETKKPVTAVRTVKIRKHSYKDK